MRPEDLDLRPKKRNLRPERPGLRLERLDLRPERPDLRPEEPDRWGRMDGRTNERTNESPPVFYRTSSPSGPRPKKRYKTIRLRGRWIKTSFAYCSHTLQTCQMAFF